MRITKTSPLTGVERTMDLPITDQQISDWKNGAPIQVAMANLTLDEREFFKTGITATEWDEHFKEEFE